MQDENTRCRKWFLTINQNAKIYSNMLNTLNDLVNKTECNYYAIMHDKDNDEQPHYHIVLDFKNAISFRSICKKFVGAHVEYVENFNRSVQYLIHKNERDKFHYDISEIITTVSDDLLMPLLCLDEFEYLNQETLLFAIANRKVFTLTDCVKLWGLKQVSRYRGIIKDLLDEFSSIYKFKQELEWYREKYGFEYNHTDTYNELEYGTDIFNGERVINE